MAREKIDPPSQIKSPSLRTRIEDGTCFLDCPDPCDDERFDHCTRRVLPSTRFLPNPNYNKLKK